MSKYNLFIAIFTLFVIALIIVGFIIGGTPASMRDLTLDSTRMANFHELERQIQNYYQTNSSLPKNLTELTNLSSGNYTDPTTRKSYDYKIISQFSYQLCATFSTDSNSKTASSIYISSPSTDKHKKGYDCLNFTLPTNITKATATPFPTAGPVAQSTRGIYLKNNSDFANKTLSMNYNGSTVLTIDFSQAIITDSKGKIIDVQKDIINGDQLEILGITTKPAYIKASQIKDLTR